MAHLPLNVSKHTRELSSGATVHVSVLEQSISTLRFSTLGGRTHVLPLTALTAMQFA